MRHRLSYGTIITWLLRSKGIMACKCTMFNAIEFRNSVLYLISISICVWNFITIPLLNWLDVLIAFESFSKPKPYRPFDWTPFQQRYFSYKFQKKLHFWLEMNRERRSLMQINSLLFQLQVVRIRGKQCNNNNTKNHFNWTDLQLPLDYPYRKAKLFMHFDKYMSKLLSIAIASDHQILFSFHISTYSCFIMHKRTTKNRSENGNNIPTR